MDGNDKRSIRFVTIWGIPPHAYLESIRIRQALRRLICSTPIAGVAYELGFITQSHFPHRFKWLLGATTGPIYLLGTRDEKTMEKFLTSPYSRRRVEACSKRALHFLEDYHESGITQTIYVPR